MLLVSDAISTSESLNKVVRFSKGRFNSSVLQEIIQDLDENEIISIIFLFTDKNTDVAEVLHFLDNTSPLNLNILKGRLNWEEKLLESLIVIGNINVIKKLGFKNNEINAMKDRFVHKEHNISENLNRVIKSLYFVSENLLKKETVKLITKVNEKLATPKIKNHKLLLEVNILHWIQQKYISINQDYLNLNNLIQDLKSIGCLMPFNFEDWKIFTKNEQDSFDLRNDNSLSFTPNNVCNQSKEYQKEIKIPWEGKNKRLCIIINIIHFDNNKYATRLASDEDERNLIKTFKGCNFEIHGHKDLNKYQMIDLLNTLNNDKRYNDYACIFMCILSHGSEGEVVFSNNEKINIQKIRNKFCCSNLQNVFKFIILQACQGTQTGFVDKNPIQNQDNLVTDGPLYPEFYFEHFGLFQATISGFAAYRDIIKGSWFIRDVCEELRISTPIAVTELTKKVTKRVSNRRSTCKSNSDIDLVQIPEFGKSTITVDYEIPKYTEVLS